MNNQRNPLSQPGYNWQLNQQSNPIQPQLNGQTINQIKRPIYQKIEQPQTKLQRILASEDDPIPNKTCSICWCAILGLLGLLLLIFPMLYGLGVIGTGFNINQKTISPNSKYKSQIKKQTHNFLSKQEKQRYAREMNQLINQTQNQLRFIIAKIDKQCSQSVKKQKHFDPVFLSSLQKQNLSFTQSLEYYYKLKFQLSKFLGKTVGSDYLISSDTTSLLLDSSTIGLIPNQIVHQRTMQKIVASINHKKLDTNCPLQKYYPSQQFQLVNIKRKIFQLQLQIRQMESKISNKIISKSPIKTQQEMSMLKTYNEWIVYYKKLIEYRYFLDFPQILQQEMSYLKYSEKQCTNQQLAKLPKSPIKTQKQIDSLKSYDQMKSYVNLIRIYKVQTYICLKNNNLHQLQSISIKKQNL